MTSAGESHQTHRSGNPSSAADAPVLVVGGGIGGLATALALAQRGFASRVLERRAQFSEQGAGIQIGPNGTRILRALGVADALEPRVGVPQWLIAHDAASGAELARLPLNADMASRFGAPYWVAHREDLHAALLERARAQPSIAITMGADIVAVTQAEHGAAVTLDSSEGLTGPLVVAADGLYSRLRGGNGAGPLAVGKSAYRTVLAAEDVDPALLRDGTRIWLARDAHVVHYAVRGGAELAIVVIVDETFDGESWSNDADLQPVLTRLKLAPQLRALLQSPRSWRKWALSTLAQLPTMAQGNVALLGDAAHPTLPFLAQGGVMALEDATVLADALAASNGDVAGALQAYRVAREPRVRRVMAASRRNGQIYHLHGLAAAARNAAMRMTPGRKLIARYDWIYGWRG